MDLPHGRTCHQQCYPVRFYLVNILARKNFQTWLKYKIRFCYQKKKSSLSCRDPFPINLNENDIQVTVNGLWTVKKGNSYSTVSIRSQYEEEALNMFSLSRIMCRSILHKKSFTTQFRIICTCSVFLDVDLNIKVLYINAKYVIFYGPYKHKSNKTDHE